MKIVCSKNFLLNSISTVQKAVTGKTTLPILDGILISGKDNQVSLTATDLDMGIETKMSSDVEVVEEVQLLSIQGYLVK